ncbi:hypothetical protein GTS_23380 [Gandjariella thermophila]|uniref:Uncharacterized protein n=2 Tax=Gandjariella thermophila TaxID=1931992 RepID=A0A4D4J256_9PSEU|nr:hypothetical protein GTS_23380 [Gandjariella thermophila]
MLRTDSGTDGEGDLRLCAPHAIVGDGGRQSRGVTRMLDLSTRLSNLPAVRGQAHWANHEYVRGWGVFGLPFDSGHVLVLRVFPENDFGPYRTVWYRDPGGSWSIYVDEARLDTVCPRYYGAASKHVGHADISLTWTGPTSLRVTMESPALDWTLTASSTRLLDFLNTISTALPLTTWRSRSIIRAREAPARALGMDHMRLSGVMPSGHRNNHASADVLYR